MIFPENPADGQVFETENGIIFVFDQSVSSWTQVSTGRIPLKLATEYADGAMSSADYDKLLSLVLPPPNIAIATDNCSVTFNQGAVELTPADDYVKINTELSAQNIDSFGDLISSNFPFKIHDYTYGVDFKIDISKFIDDMIVQNRVKFKGATGNKGPAGNKGPQGPSNIFTGPQGNKGDDGDGIPCVYDVKTESIAVTPTAGLNMAITSAEITTDTSDPTKRRVLFHRKAVGTSNPATRLTTSGGNSPWLLVLDNSGGAAQQAYYVDIDGITDTIYNTYAGEVKALKESYEAVIKNYVGLMSKTFDKQKDALCCALQKCMSQTKNNENRQHMESVAAGAAGKAKIVLRSKNDPDAVFISGTKGLADSGLGTDDCASTSTGTFPQPPKYGTSTEGGDAITNPGSGSSNSSSSSSSSSPIIIVPPRPSNSSSSASSKTSSGSSAGSSTSSAGSSASSAGSSASSSTGGCYNTIFVDSSTAVQNALAWANQQQVVKNVGGISMSDCIDSPYNTEVCNLTRSHGPICFPYYVYERYTLQKRAGDGTLVKVEIEIASSSYATGPGSAPVKVTTTGTWIPAPTSGTIYTKFLPFGTNGPADDTVTINAAQAQKAARISSPNRYSAQIDAALNSSILTSHKLNLPAGDYTAKIIVATAKADSFYRSNAKFTYRTPNGKRSSEFQQKGQFTDLQDARDVYEGLAASFVHNGGETEWWLPVEPGVNCSGQISIEISPIQEQYSIMQAGYCTMTPQKIRWYQEAWRKGECCGAVLNFNDQDYIVMQKSIGDDLSCGGGEIADEPCINLFHRMGHPAFAFPTFNGKDFIATGKLNFKYDANVDLRLKQIIRSGQTAQKIGRQKYDLILVPTL